MKTIKKALPAALLGVLMNAFPAHAQPVPESEWEYFTIEDTITAVVIGHLQKPDTDYLQEKASITIVVTAANDTLRIFHSSDLKIKKGKALVITGGNEPEEGFVTTAILEEDPVTKEQVAGVFFPTVRKTAWGTVLLQVNKAAAFRKFKEKKKK